MHSSVNECHLYKSSATMKAMTKVGASASIRVGRPRATLKTGH